MSERGKEEQPESTGGSGAAVDAAPLVIDTLEEEQGMVFPADDPAFADDQPVDERGVSGGRVAADDVHEEDDEPIEASPTGMRPERLALVLLVLAPGLGFALYTTFFGERPPPAPPELAQFPAPPFETTTDEPMNAVEVKSWLETPPPAPTEAQLQALGERRDKANDGPAVPPPPGHLFQPKKGALIELDASKTPTKPKRPAARRRSGQRKKPSNGAAAASASSGLPSLEGLTARDPAEFIYEAGEVKNSEVFAARRPTAPEDPAGRGIPAVLAAGDSFAVRLHSGLSSVSSDPVVLVRVTKTVRKDGRLVIPRDAIVRGEIQNYGERRFFLKFGTFTVEQAKYQFEGRAEERNYAGVVAIRREATLQERQRSTVINGVLSGLMGATAMAAPALPPGVREAGQAIASGTRDNTLREERVREGFVLEAAKGKRFRILVTK